MSIVLGYEPLAEIAAAAGFPVDQLNYVVCLLLAFPLSELFYLVPASQSQLRHVLGIALGLVFGFFCFGTQMIHPFFTATVVYLLLIVDKGQHPFWVGAFAMTYLLGCHLYRYFYDYGNYTLDFTGPQMILTQKLSTIAFGLYDGRRRKKDEKLVAEQEIRALAEVPSLLEFYGHVFFFASFLAGPNHHFNQYMDMIRGKHNQDKVDRAGFVAYRKLILGLIYMLLTLLPGMLYGYNVDMRQLVNDEWLEQSNIATRVVHLIISAMLIRMQYYFAWTVAEGANNVAGLGYNGLGKNHHARWDGVSNVKVLNVEGALNMKMVLDNWNTQTQAWLKYVCYDRVHGWKVTKTMMLSAIWHGTYAGYFMTFGSAALVTEASRKARRVIRPLFQTSPALSKLYDACTWALSIFLLDYMVGPFVMLDIPRSLKVWSQFYYAGHIIMIAAILLLPAKGGDEKKKDASDPKKLQT